MSFYKKYLKYKSKYLTLKNIKGGNPTVISSNNENIIKTKEQVDMLISEIIKINPEVNHDKINKSATYNDVGDLESFNFRDCGIKILPYNFGYIQVIDTLDLTHNSIRVVPDSFNCIKFGNKLLINPLSFLRNFIDNKNNIYDADKLNNKIPKNSDNIRIQFPDGGWMGIHDFPLY